MELGNATQGKINFNFQNLTNTVPGILVDFSFLHYRCCQYDINADYYSYVRAGEFLTSSLEYKYRVIFVVFWALFVLYLAQLDNNLLY